MNTEKTTGGAEQPRDPRCFEEWLHFRLQEKPDREDEIGRVARWVLERMKPGHRLRWVPEPVLLARYGHFCDVPAHYESHLKHFFDQPKDSVETFSRVYDLYLKEVSADYDRKIEEVGKRLDRNFGGGGNGGGGRKKVGGAVPDDSWESWNQFFYEIYGSEMLGYELDEDGYPIDGEEEGDVEQR